jgi:hypothetical protein
LLLGYSALVWWLVQIGKIKGTRVECGVMEWSFVNVGKTGLGKTMDARRDIYSKSIERCDQTM